MERERSLKVWTEMQETRDCSVTSGLRPSAPGPTAIFNPRDPKAVLAEFTVLFALPPSLS